MIMSQRNTISIFVFLLIFSCFEGKAQFSFSAELRPRTEYSHGYESLASVEQNPSLFTSQRSRLNLSFKNKRFRTKLVVQDVRLWGNQPQLVGNEDFATSIHEAWGELFFKPEFSLKVGRQELIYDDHRIFGNVGWAQQARSHDLALFRYSKDFNLHVGIAYHENSNRSNNVYDGPDAYKTMQFVWFNQKFSNFTLSVLFLNNGIPYPIEVIGGEVTKEGIRFSQTFGPRVLYKLGDLNLSGNFYVQTGKDRTGDKLSAFEFAVDGVYSVTDGFKVNLGYEMLSGTAYDEEPDKNKSFTPFYGTNHKFNGFMDYFYVGNHINNVGLNDFHFGGKYSWNKVFVQGKLLVFSSAARIDADVNNYLGTEIDLWMGYNIVKDVKLGAGYSHLFASESMEFLKGGDTNVTQNWAYVMLTFTPNFFTTKNAPDN